MARVKLGATAPAQRDFSVGQIDWDARARDDSKLRLAACKVCQNWRPLPSGALEQRPGSRNVKFYDTNARRVELIRANGRKLHTAVFYPGGVEFLDEADDVVTSISGAPWDGDDLQTMRWTQAEDSLVIACNSFRPQVVNWDGTDWNLTDFEFREDRGGTLRQPYYRFEPDATTMRPSARNGSIEVNFSTGFLTADHVGARFRYGDQELEITSVVTSSKANADVIEQLPPTYKVWVRNVRGLKVGDYVEGDESGAYGEVVGIQESSPESVRIVMLRGWSGFERDEYMVGRNFRGQVYAPGDGDNRAHQEIVDPGDAVRWDEQFMSEARGWPGCTRFSNNRLTFSDFTQLPSAVLWSAPTLLLDFKISADPASAILELIPGNVRVFDVVGEGDQFVFTNAGIYYVPVGTLIAAGQTQFQKIGADGVASVPPVVTTDGIAFLSAGKNRVLAVVPTGQEKRPYEVREVSELHSKLVADGEWLAASPGDGTASGRFIYLRKSDGNLAIGRPTGDGFGWFHWEYRGNVIDVVALGAELRMIVDYGENRALERVSDTALLDGLVDASAASVMQSYAGKTVTLEREGRDLGDYVVHANGSLIGYSGGLANTNAGFSRDRILTVLLPSQQPGEAAGQRERRRRPVRAWVDVDRTQGFSFFGRVVPDFLPGEPTNVAPPRRTTKYRARRLGRSFEPEITIEQDGPRRIAVLEVGAEITT